jgi:hypothetical protein
MAEKPPNRTVSLVEACHIGGSLPVRFLQCWPQRNSAGKPACRSPGCPDMTGVAPRVRASSFQSGEPANVIWIKPLRSGGRYSRHASQSMPPPVPARSVFDGSFLSERGKVEAKKSQTLWRCQISRVGHQVDNRTRSRSAPNPTRNPSSTPPARNDAERDVDC